MNISPFPIGAGGNRSAAILLLDDEKERRDFMRALLQANGYAAVQATHCENAHSALAHQKIDVILLNLALPDTNGVRFLEFLQQKDFVNWVIGTNGFSLLESIGHVLSIQTQGNPGRHPSGGEQLPGNIPMSNHGIVAGSEWLDRSAAARMEIQDYTVLIDLRDMNDRLSSADVFELASELVQCGRNFRRENTGYLVADEGLDQAAFFEEVAQRRGFKVFAITVFKDALRWLASISRTKGDRADGREDFQR
jgi:hypothetical protein